MKSKAYYFLGSQLSALSLPFLIFYFIMLTIGLSDSQALHLIQHSIFIGLVLTVILLFPTLSIIYYSKTQRLEILEDITISFLRYVVSFLMFYYGFAKIYSKFFEITYLTQDSRVIDVEYFKLTWYYYGKSNKLEVIFGLFELIPALLILFRGTYFIGILLIFPVAANVLLINIFNEISGITYFVSWIITLNCLYIIYSKKDLIIRFIKTLTESKVNLNSIEKTLRLFFKFLTIIVICYYTFVVIKTKFTKSEETDFVNRNKKTGAYELVSLEKNGKLIIPKEGDNYYKTIYLEPQRRWNTILTFAKTYNPINLTVNWSNKTDSVTTYLKLNNSVENNEVDSTSEFTGTFIFKDSLLVINGLQKSDTIIATYKKKNLKDFKWFW